MNISRLPDHLHVVTEDDILRIEPGETCGRDDIAIQLEASENGLGLSLSAKSSPIRALHLRWNETPASGALYMADAWGRQEGEMQWATLTPHRPMPWFFMVHHGGATGGVGVRTNPDAIASWQIDTEGLSLYLDTRNGGSGVVLEGRTITPADILLQPADQAQSPYEAACAFCAKLATETPRARGELYYGGNNWYYAYGDITHASCVADAERIAEWSPDGAEKPYMVIDDGWQVAHCDNRYNSGPWHTGNVRFPDMPRLAAEMADRGIRPGIWYRPLVNLEGHMEPFMIRNGNLPSYSKGGYAMDPTFPEVRQRLEDDAVRLSDWGFQMIKHDFTTVDLLGTWCGTSGPMATPSSGWHFNDRSLTNAEIVKDLYRRIMQAAGETRIIGCQTLGHLGVGSIDLQRAGGDVSGRDWERTRRMGPNSLAFRMPQHDRFFQVDADCAPVTPKVPWKFAKQWLDLLARSGTPLFISANPESVNDETLPFIKDMLAVAASHPSPAEPLDWMDTPTPRIWKTSDGEKTYNWLPEIGCAPAGLVPGDPTCILKGNT